MAADILRVAADILRVAADISRVEVDKAVEEAKSCWSKNFFHFFENFSKLFGIFDSENTFFFLKELKNGLISEKNTPKWNILPIP